MDKNILNELSGRSEKTKIYNLRIDEIIYLKDKIPFNKYCLLVEQYLSLRIENNMIYGDKNLEKLRSLYDTFSKDERTTLKYLQKIYGYIEELVYISKNNYTSKKEKINSKEITIKKLMSLQYKMKPIKFANIVKTFLNESILNKNYITSEQLFDLEPIIEYINENNEVRNDQKQEISKLTIKLIVFSRHSNKKNFLKRLSKLYTLSLDELYLYLETIVIHAHFCLIEKELEEIISLFRNKLDYLEQIEDLLHSYNINTNCYDLIINYKNKINEQNKFRNEFPNIVINYDYIEKELPFIETKNVITIDESYSPDLDGAFSVEKEGDMYILKVYVTDVPSFLLKNEKLMKEAYNRGTSMYNNQNKYKMLIRDMLPPEVSHDFLSLKKGNKRNVIIFTYYIDKNGKISLNGISRNSVLINDNITPTMAHSIISNQSEYNTIHRDLNIYKEVCDLISNNASVKYLKNANTDKIGNIVGLPSILTNYYIGNNSSLAIYRDKGIYTKESEDKYTQSVTPLRRFVSDINLAIYLNQIGIINCPDKYIHYVEDNLDEIIEHLNAQEKVCEEFQKNYRKIKQYYQ